MSFNDRLRERLQTMIVNLGGMVPKLPSLADEENRTLALLDSLTPRLATTITKLVTFRARTPADCVAQWFFIADRNYLITRIDYVHATPESTSGELYARVAIGSGAIAPAAAGAAHSAVFDCRAGAANVVQTRSGTDIDAPAVNLGDRLAVQFIFGTPNQLAGVCLVVTLVPA